MYVTLGVVFKYWWIPQPEYLLWKQLERRVVEEVIQNGQLVANFYIVLVCRGDRLEA